MDNKSNAACMHGCKSCKEMYTLFLTGLIINAFFIHIKFNRCANLFVNGMNEAGQMACLNNESCYIIVEWVLATCPFRGL